jgi:tRNA/rRNA methyltransferase
MFNNIFFILHKPQLSENIGACARAMKNFNFSKLIVIKPKPTFPNDKIIATSVGAKEIIKKSKVYDTLEPAMKNIDILISTTSRFRNKNIKHIKLNKLNKINFNKKIAFLFGSEASGLSNNEISFSNYVLQIPSNPNFKSLNLSHSLIIVAQTVFQILNIKQSIYSKSKKIKSASKKNIQAMTNLCIKHLEEINFFKPQEKKPKMLENLRSIFYKMDLSEKETRILSSVFASLAKKKLD